MNAVPARNRLPAALPVREGRRIVAACEPVEFTVGEMIYRAGRPITHAYFPTTACIALVLAPPGTGAGLEVSLVGSEGMVGTAPLLGVALSPQYHLVQTAGAALRLTTQALLRELDRSPALRLRLNRYLHVKMHQMAQTAVCARFHLVEQRLACWLLMTHDRASSPELQATHEFLARLLGVRRVGITKAATSLQRLAVIRYSRGSIKILDRPGLERRSCSCYRAAVRLYEQTLG